MNLLLNSDSYKYSMHVQYPPGTEYVYSYIESRGGPIPETVFFGLQGFIKDYLTKQITKAQIDEAESYLMPHIGVFNREGWEYIINAHRGYLPIEIWAAQEGAVIPTGNALVTIVNTDPKCFWLTTFIETALLRAIWYPTTIASQGYVTRKVIKNYLDLTSEDSSSIDYMLHDFGCRGVSSLESSRIGGAAHLVNFKGTDNVPALNYIRTHYYTQMAGHSVPAMEHSTVTGWGRNHEFDSYNNMIEQYQGFAVVSCVSDSYDIYEACHYVGKHLKDKIIESNQTYVIRPDSGNPTEVIIKCLEILENYFPCSKNYKGYKTLEHVKVLWGDGINHDSIGEILYVVTLEGYSTDNLVFGSGGALLQQMNRDTMKFAMKCSAICVNGEWRDVYKEPITDNVKKSKKGRVTLYHNPTKQPSYFTDLLYRTENIDGHDKIALRKVFRNGHMFSNHTLDSIRNKLHA